MELETRLIIAGVVLVMSIIVVLSCLVLNLRDEIKIKDHQIEDLEKDIKASDELTQSIVKQIRAGKKFKVLNDYEYALFEKTKNTIYIVNGRNVTIQKCNIKKGWIICTKKTENLSIISCKILGKKFPIQKTI